MVQPAPTGQEFDRFKVGGLLGLRIGEASNPGPPYVTKPVIGKCFCINTQGPLGLGGPWGKTVLEHILWLFKKSPCPKLNGQVLLDIASLRATSLAMSLGRCPQELPVVLLGWCTNLCDAVLQNHSRTKECRFALFGLRGSGASMSIVLQGMSKSALKPLQCFGHPLKLIAMIGSFLGTSIAPPMKSMWFLLCYFRLGPL